ncbi:hypothetical protein V3C99_007906 [Haemonchus contortus]
MIPMDGNHSSQQERHYAQPGAMHTEATHPDGVSPADMPESMDSLQRRESRLSFESDEISEIKNCAEEGWSQNSEAQCYQSTSVGISSALSAFYSLFLTISAVVLELSHVLSEEEEREVTIKDMIFGMYMYGVSILFFFYMYIVLLLNPQWYWAVNVLQNCLRKPDTRESSLCSTVSTTRKVTHAGTSTGSLFLRFGCVVFGVIGVVYYSFLVFLCFVDSSCSVFITTLEVFSIVFIFVQMHFIFCNSKLSITGHHPIARFGTMHLIAANLWTWIRYVLLEEGAMEKEIREVFHVIHSQNESGMEKATVDAFEHRDIESGCQSVECMLGSVSEMMYAAIVEYSLIAAAVMYIVWKNIGRVHYNSEYVKRKYHIRMDCSNTTTGLFLGLIFLIGTFSSMLIYYGYSILGESTSAAFAYAITDIVQYIMATIGCVIAIYYMRSLSRTDKRDSHSSKDQELLDHILLMLGLVGELMYSVAGLVGLTGEGQWQPLAFLLFVVHILRLIQVGTQTFVIYLATKVKAGTSNRRSQPGKQAITFLLAVNLSLFMMNLFQSQKPALSENIIDFYGKRSWVFLVRSFSPLTVFYRFHSSVCLAEIWKSVYASK